VSITFDAMAINLLCASFGKADLASKIDFRSREEGCTIIISSLMYGDTISAIAGDFAESFNRTDNSMCCVSPENISEIPSSNVLLSSFSIALKRCNMMFAYSPNLECEYSPLGDFMKMGSDVHPLHSKKKYLISPRI
jgi:hypothetical protein